MSITLAWRAIAPRDKLPQSRVEPLVKVIVPRRFAFPEFPTVTAPDTVSWGLPVVANVSVATPLAEPIATLVQAALLISTVTVIPVLIVTVSPATGTDKPPHVAVELQLPVTLAVLAAAFAGETAEKTDPTASSATIHR